MLPARSREAIPTSTPSSNAREGGRVRQRIIRALGRLLVSGELDRLAASLVRYCNRAVILSDRPARHCRGVSCISTYETERT
jgi:hypothetical protein